MTEEQVEGTTIPKVVPVEGVMPEAEVLEGAASEPEVKIAPEATEEVCDDALPESSTDVVIRRRRSRMQSQYIRRRCQKLRQLVVVG
jgi:hypothetical protein